MKKKNWFKMIAITTISITCVIYIVATLIHAYKVNNFVLEDSSRFEKIQTTHFTCGSYYTYIPSFSGGNDRQTVYESYKTDNDELTLVYIKDVYSDRYLKVYDKDNIITNPVATIKISYAPNQETPLYEQAETKYASFNDSDQYKLLEHSYLPPEDDNYTTWEEVYAHYYLTVFPEYELDDISFPESEWDKEAFRFAVLDRDTKDIIEVVYFERTDGIYCVEMNYPRNNDEVRNELYEEFLFLIIHADKEPLTEMYENLECTETWEDDNILTVTAVNNSSYTIPNLSFSFDCNYTQAVNGYNGRSVSAPTFENVKPGEEVSYTFTITDEDRTYLKSYNVTTNIYEEVRYISDPGTLIFGE